MKKDKYNIVKELLLVLPHLSSPIFVRHCAVCDTNSSDMFIEWLDILKASSKLSIPVRAKQPFLDLAHASTSLRRCIECGGYTITQAVFEWVN